MRATGNSQDIELIKLRFDYAWKYFESAARQRMLFFNYFLIAVGILGSAIGFAIKEGMSAIVLFAGIFGLVASAAFITFDIRMLAFVKRALRVLDALERESLFPNGYTASYPDEERTQLLGLARIEPDRRAAGKGTGHKITKVKWWIRSVEALAGMGFLAAVIFAAASMGKTDKPSPQSKRQHSVPRTKSPLPRAVNPTSNPATEPSTQEALQHSETSGPWGANGICSLDDRQRRLGVPSPALSLSRRAFRQGHTALTPQPTE